jgi:hypothetical protein
METPQQIQLSALAQLFLRFYRDKTLTIANGREQICKVCAGPIHLIGTYISIHSELFGGRCSGGGQVVRQSIPYCPHCEAMPELSGCVHVPHELSRQDVLAAFLLIDHMNLAVQEEDGRHAKTRDT